MPAPSSSVPTFDVAVIGAGPSGLTAALAFAAEGLDTALVAPAANLDDGRTTALLHASVGLLDRVGVWEDVHDKAAPLARMRMIDDTGRLFRAPEVTFNCAELGLDAFGYNIANADLNAALERAATVAPNLTIFQDTGDRYAFGETDVTITAAGGHVLSSRLVVAADGRKSSLREAAGIDVRTWSYPQVAVVLNLEHDRPHHDISTEFHKKTGPFTLVPLPGNRSSLVCVETAEGALRLGEMSDDALALELEHRAHSILGRFKIATRRQMFPLSGMNAKSLIGNRVALIGEAAHVFPPIGAQGLNLSLRDVAGLVAIAGRAKAMDQDPGSADILSRYERQRWTDITTRTGAVDLLNRSLLSDFIPLQLARCTGLYLADRIGPLRRLLMREGMAPGTAGSLPAISR